MACETDPRCFYVRHCCVFLFVLNSEYMFILITQALCGLQYCRLVMQLLLVTRLEYVHRVIFVNHRVQASQ